MQITKFKKMSNGKYKVYFSNDLNILLYEDIILKYNLLTNKYVNSELLDEITLDNNKYMSYDLALNYIKIKMRCEKEIREYLEKKNIDNNSINNVVDKLKQNGYLDTQKYIKSYIYDKFNLSNIGPLKIKNELLKLGFNEEDIDSGLSIIDKDELYSKLNKLIDKRIIQIKHYNGSILKQKIIKFFIEKGFYKSDIEDILANKNLNNKDLLLIEYNKLYSKYSKKYSGVELENIIKQKLYQKGFNYNEI